jgi:hypothetical protein
MGVSRIPITAASNVQTEFDMIYDVNEFMAILLVISTFISGAFTAVRCYGD